MQDVMKNKSTKSKSLAFKNTNDIQLITHAEQQKGAVYLEENSILFLISGKLTISYGMMKEQASENQLIFLKKNILIAYEMDVSGMDGCIEYIVFKLRSDLITEFTKMADLSSPFATQLMPFIITGIDNTFSHFIASLQACLFYPESIQSRLSKIKLMELLFYLASYNTTILSQLLQLRERFQTNITALVEENILNSMPLHQLAVLAGRSLSSFRRDFLSIYNMPPSQWIRQQRLEKAKDLLCSTTMSITDICYTTGFENIAHFSRLFKSHYRSSPSEFRQNVLVA
jgi:AraC-like DNA-binding protein